MNFTFNLKIGTDKVLGNLVALQDTKLKIKVGQSQEGDEYVEILKDTSIPVLSHNRVKDNHQKYCFNGFIGPTNKSTWYVFVPHWLFNEVEHKIPTDKPVQAAPQFTKSLTIPNLKLKTDYINVPIYGRVSLSDPLPGCRNFNWSEATHGGSRIPYKGGCVGRLTPEDVVRNFIRIGKEMDKIRDHYKRPITVNSWYRPPSVNKAVGGSSNSQHLYGTAVDFVVSGVHSKEILRWLEPTWKGGLAGTTSNAFSHVDCRNLIGFPAGRWTYPF